MNQRNNKNKSVEQSQNQALNEFKHEVARELGYNYEKSLAELSSRENGHIGGYMVKKMIEAAKKQEKQNK